MRFRLPKVLGAAEVVGVCSQRNADLVRSPGCDRVIGYQQQDFTQEATQYSIVFDVVGNRSFDNCKRVLQPKGYYVTTQPYPANFLQGFLTTFLPGPKYRVILLKSNAADIEFMAQHTEAGKIESVINRTYPLSETAEAHCCCETERTVGKVVITIAS